MSNKYINLKIFLLVILLGLSNSTTFINPINPIYSSDTLISLSDSNDPNKFVIFNYVLSQSGTNYFDLRNGEVYKGLPVLF